jgi:hypothetical protein
VPSEPVHPPTASEPVSQPPALFGVDDKGFVNSNARCAGTQTVVALGRTERSFVVICANENGQYEYLGVRLSDDAVLKATAETTPAHEFLARNAGVTYTVTPAELLVMTGDTVIRQEPMIDYHASGTVPTQVATR